ncbi:MAG: glutathione-disulfide reductase [Geminicoccaceae bacterium]
MPDFDLFVIGGGSGGVACARRAASHGARVGLAEHSRVGGTCVIRGCVPKKLMHYGAHFQEWFKAAHCYGWEIGEPRLAFERLCEARNQEIARLNGIYLQMLERAGVTLFPAHARILEQRDGEAFVVQAGEREVTAARVLVAVGARPSLPDVPGIELAWSSDEVLENVYPLPERLAVVGAGYIGLELASIFNALGSKTTLVLRGDMPLRGFEHDLRQHLTVEIEGHGVALWNETRVERIERAGDCLHLATSRGPLAVDAVIYATGRTPLPQTAALGLEAHGVRLQAAGTVAVDAAYDSSNPLIHAVGDCSDHAGTALEGVPFDLTPVAIAEGRALAERLFNDNPLAVNYATIPTAVFTLPQAASVGLSEAKARAAGHEVTIYRTSFRPMFHTLTGGTTRTMMKLVVDRTSDRVLGCHMVGEDAAEMIQGFAVALTAGATKEDFDATVALHPTAAEEFVTMYQPHAG